MSNKTSGFKRAIGIVLGVVAKTQIGLGAVMYGGMEKPPEASARTRHIMQVAPAA